MLDLLGKGTDRGYSMIGVGLTAGLSGSRRARTVQDPVPALDLDWATNRSLPASYGPTPTFTRASTGTYFDGQGILKSAAVNGPRFNHVYNGTSWVSRGLLVEEQRTNNCPNSETFANWNAQSGTSVTDASVSGPKGNNTASIINEGNQNTNYKGVFQLAGNSTSATYSLSIFAKYNDLRYLAIHLYDDAASYATVIFDLTTGLSTAATSLGNWSSVTASSVDCGNGWYRLSMRTTSAGVVGFVGAVRPANASTGFSASYGAPAAYTGTNRTSYIFGAQLEQGSFPTSYIPTTTASVTRSADVCQITGSDFSGFWNGTEGALSIEYDQNQYATGANNYAVAALSSGTALMAITSSLYGGSPSTYWQVYNGTAQAEIPFSMIQNGTAFKFAAAYKANDFAATQNGAAVGTDTSGSIPSANQMSIGYFAGFGQYINGHIARLRYYPVRLSNSKLQELST